MFLFMLILMMMMTPLLVPGSTFKRSPVASALTGEV
jgi:hypothetical protein